MIGGWFSVAIHWLSDRVCHVMAQLCVSLRSPPHLTHKNQWDLYLVSPFCCLQGMVVLSGCGCGHFLTDSCFSHFAQLWPNARTLAKQPKSSKWELVRTEFLGFLISLEMEVQIIELSPWIACYVPEIYVPEKKEHEVFWRGEGICVNLQEYGGMYGNLCESLGPYTTLQKGDGMLV